MLKNYCTIKIQKRKDVYILVIIIHMAKENGLKILVYGSGAREQAIADAVSVGNKVIVYAEPSGFGFDLVIFGPEKPLCEGLADEFRAKNIPCIGVNKKWARLEGSKLFAKEFMDRHGIKNARVLEKVESYPVVKKCDGLCEGKGVKIIYENAPVEIPNDCFYEEYLEGEEISVMSLFDGKTLLNFVSARDFKRLSADPNSPNTGGMGAYCPVDLTSIQQEKLDKYLKQLENALLHEKADFVGFIYSGLIWTREDWYVLEYNVRLGDPEAQAILTHLKTDFLSILQAALAQKLDEVKLEYREDYSACLVVAAQGYPEKPIIGDEITYPENSQTKIYHAGVKTENGKLYSNGGRVLSLCTNAKDPFPILKDFADKIQMKKKYYRNDIEISQKD